MSAIKTRWIETLDAFQAWGEVAEVQSSPLPTDADLWEQARGVLGDLVPVEPDAALLAELRDAYHGGRMRAADAAQTAGRYAIPAAVAVVGPTDQESGAWWGEDSRGRHALLIGDPQDGGTAYAGTLAELEELAARITAAVAAARAAQPATVAG